jgi:hypothetical protein
LEGNERMSESQSNYVSYLLRLWQVNSAGQPVWRASLEDTRTGERHGFADPASLFAFLKKVIQAQPGPAPSPPDARSPPGKQP